MGCNMKATVVNQAQLSDKIALAALIVAILSLLLSIINVRVQQNLNQINLEAKYYASIFDSYILKKIPDKIAALTFTNNKLDKNYQELNDVMMQMVRDSRYFALSNPLFYKGLTEKTMNLDELLVSISGKTIIPREMQTKKIVEIENAVSKIIVYINSYHSHKSIIWYKLIDFINFKFFSKR